MITPLRLLMLALLTSSAFGLTDCKKDKEPDPKKPSQREIWLTTSGWSTQRIEQVYTSPAGVVTTATIPISAFDPCYLDDLNYFNADRTFTVDDGAVICQQQVPSTTWDFASNETEIVFGSATEGSKITTLTATTLVLASTYIAPDGAMTVQSQIYVAR